MDHRELVLELNEQLAKLSDAFFGGDRDMVSFHLGAATGYALEMKKRLKD